MTNKEKIGYLLGALITITTSFTSYVVTDISSNVDKLEAKLEKFQDKHISDIGEIKDNYEYVLKNYKTKEEHNIDIKRIEDRLSECQICLARER